MIVSFVLFPFFPNTGDAPAPAREPPAGLPPPADDASQSRLEEVEAERARLSARLEDAQAEREALRDRMVIALLNGTAVTLKKFYLVGRRVRLQPAKPGVEPLVVEADQVEIRGVLMGVLRRY